MGDLRVFDSDVDKVIAKDEGDARTVWRETYGEECPAEYQWDAVPEKTLIAIRDDAGNVTKLTAREWIERNGRGHLSCSEC
jgi:hypothetical protein